MEQQVAEYYDDITLLGNYLEDGYSQGWSHQLRKHILFLLHKLKSASRKLNELEMESELIAIEFTLGFGTGQDNEPDKVQIEEHQLRLLELIEKAENQKETGKPDIDNLEIESDVELSVEPVVDPVFEVSVEPDLEPELESPASQGVIQLVICNCPGRDAARELARNLVKARFAACINIIANIGAIYWWDGEIQDTVECQLQIKTSNQTLEDVISYIKKHHPDDVPEILVIPITKGNTNYFE